jgi:integrase/recombinase XerD
MNGLGEVVQEYLSVRRALGYKLEREGMLLPKFAGFVEAQGSPHLTTELAVQWATQPVDASPNWSSRRLGIVRRFALHASALDPRTEVPPADLISYRKTRHPPYLYTDADVRALMQACTRLRGRLRPFTYATLIGLLAVTGMRVGEAIALDRSDLDEGEQVLTIRHSKFNKSREVPLHSTTFEALNTYARKRDRVLRRPKSPSFFLSRAGSRLLTQNVWATFSRLRRWAGLTGQPCPPRIHDLRHSFALNIILRWYREGVEVEPRIARLSTYLGHVSPSSTYWYLTATPELLRLAAQRVKRRGGETS